MIDPKRYITNAIVEYKKYSDNSLQSRFMRIKILGAIECAICVAGVYEPGQPFDYLEVEDCCFFWKSWKWKRSESYSEHILRKANEFLAQGETNVPRS